jgi:beta-ureidopropionase
MIDMKYMKNASRRSFIKQSSLGLGAGIAGLGVSGPLSISGLITENKKLPREIRAATIDLRGLLHDVTSESRIKGVLERMEELTGLQPDIICLPELFSTMWVQEQKPLSDIAEDEKIPGKVAGRISLFARKNNCYVVCPLITRKSGNYYNSSLLIDRKGNIAGVYHKMHPVKTEIFPDQEYKGGGVVPGEIDQPVIETDFGKVGMQICYDANWPQGWEDLKKKGADIILFPSAFPGGRILNYFALRNNIYIISSAGINARIIDISGNDLDSTSEFVRYAWAGINMEKVNVTTWPTNGVLPDVFKKYGDRLGIKVWDKTDVITIESRDPGLKVHDVLKEFEIPTYAELLKHETEVQEKYRR